MTPTSEPVTLGGLITAGGACIVGLLVAFTDWQPTDAQITALSGLFAFLALLVAFFVRAKVTPNNNVALTQSDVRAFQELSRDDPPPPV